MNNIPEGKQFNLDDIFSNLPQEVETFVDVPSKSKFYNGAKIKIRPMTFEDEKSMVMAKKNKSDVINVLLSRCVQGVNVQDLLLVDKLYLILKLREISYGDSYSATVNCMKCSGENRLTFSLSDLPVQELDDSIQEETEIELPVTKVKLKIRIPTISDEKYLNTDTGLFDNLWRFVISINGLEDPVVIAKVLEDKRMPLKDIHAISDLVSLKDFGVQTTVRFDCDKCSQPNIIGLPIGPDFFTVN